jgi:hypothetical protein
VLGQIHHTRFVLVVHLIHCQRGAMRGFDARNAQRATRIGHDGAFIGIPTPCGAIRVMPMEPHDAASS